MSILVDGRSRFKCSLAEFYRRRDIVQQATRAGIMIPPTSDVAEEAPPAPARLNPLTPFEMVSRWIADCPDCRGGTAYVWLSTPLMFCIQCGNGAIGGKWRRVEVPAERRQIEDILLRRGDVARMSWTPGETLDLLRAENETLGVGG